MEESKEELSFINTFIKRAWHGSVRFVCRTISSPQDLYLWGATIVLLASTIFWAVLGARLQLHNADQLSDPYMFSDAGTFRGASFPGQHTFLIKWPIFWLTSVLGITSGSLTAATVAVVLLTVGTLAFILYKIDRRPLILGTLYLALAFVLLLVPTHPYAGGLLPVNMAMLTTRNLEYAAYIVSIIMFIRATRLRSWWFAGGVGLLALLIASDKLFVGLTLGGAGLALVFYALLSNWRMVAFATRWLLGGAAAMLGATLMLFAITALRLTNLVSDSGVSPYALSLGAKNIVTGVGYALLGLLTNFGANPAYDNRTLATLPHDIVTRLFSVSGLLHVLAIVLFCIGVVCVWRVLRPLLNKKTDQTQDPAGAVLLSMALAWSTIAALGMFVATQHYYAVDARYLTIGLFTLFVAAATALRSFTPKHPGRVMMAGLILAGGILAGVMNAHVVSVHQNAAYDELSARDATIVQILKRHKVDALVGDYWRVLPIKLASGGDLTVTPLSGCTSVATVLTSKTWQPDLKQHNFAYLITIDGSLTNYPKCTLSEISQAYGRPNSVQVISGTLADPKEALLFYDQGSHAVTTNSNVSAAAAPLFPVRVGQLTNTGCDSPTIMNFVAHEDDDLLFLSPDLLHNLQSGNCVRTVYLTAGDSGSGKLYWLSRQLGVQVAYSTMLGVQNVWDQQTLALTDGQYVTVATLRDNARVSLIFMNLPDGNVHGDGFPDTRHESLAKLYDDSIPTLYAVDRQSNYTTTELITALATLMDVYQPAEIHTQADVPSDQYPDHSDHIITSRLTTRAAQEYDQKNFGGVVTIPVKRYIGYPIHAYDANVSPEDLALKQAAFFAYAHYDGGVCGSIERCAQISTYDAYLSRQYQQDE